MKNTLSDLNNHLFMQLERLNDEELKGEELQEEIQRSASIASISKTIVDNAKTQLDAMKLVSSGSLTESQTNNVLSIAAPKQ